MNPGTEVALGDRTFVIPALTFGMLRSGLLEKIKEADALVGTDQGIEIMNKRCEVILAAFRRNYSEDEVSDEEFYSRLDLSNFNAAWYATIGLTSGEAVAAIEAGT